MNEVHVVLVNKVGYGDMIVRIYTQLEEAEDTVKDLEDQSPEYKDGATYRVESHNVRD